MLMLFLLKLLITSWLLNSSGLFSAFVLPFVGPVTVFFTLHLLSISSCCLSFLPLLWYPVPALKYLLCLQGSIQGRLLFLSYCFPLSNHIYPQWLCLFFIKDFQVHCQPGPSHQRSKTQSLLPQVEPSLMQILLYCSVLLILCCH